MTLLSKLYDSKEGLMGMTENGERVHLGIPVQYCHIEEFGYTSFKRASEVIRLFVLEDLQVKKLEAK